MISLLTASNTERILQEGSAALGLPVREIRRRYPAKQVRRSSILQAVRHCEDLGLVEVRGDRVRWRGPIPEDARPLGIPWRRLKRDLALSPVERVEMMAALSNALIREPKPR
jgi:hypothetical protein